MGKKIKRLLIGRPLKNEAIDGQKYNVFLGLPILASDPISSVAYASEEILRVLIPAIGIMAFSHMTYITCAIVLLLLILTFSYRQTIQNYPSGGGAYIVAADNLGKVAGVIAGAALTIDYILTVAVSISAGTAAITSAFQVLIPYTVPICLLILAIVMTGNLRGIKESSRMFSIPTYAFIFAILCMIVVGIYKVVVLGYHPAEQFIPEGSMHAVTIVLMLKAFSSGCTALTGVEAVSNAIPNFKEPTTKNAKAVLLLLSFFVLILFGGTSILANLYHVIPNNNETVLSQIASEIFRDGKAFGNFMYFFIQATTAIILSMAANTSYSDFPLLVSIMAKEGYAPRQLSMRGDRLSFSNGIIVLSGIAAILIIIFRGNTNALIPLYAIGVFISFTLSQFGMFVKWLRLRDKHWHYKAFINGLGAAVTAIVVVVIGTSKFKDGAWIVILVIPILVFLMLRVKRHYAAVAKQLKVSSDELTSVDITRDVYKNCVIVPIESMNKASLRALRYARTISDNVTAFNVSIDEESGQKLKERYSLINTDIPLIIKYSPFRRVVEPLLKFIESTEYDYHKGDMITVVLPQFSIKEWWQNILHNHSRLFIERELLKHKHIVVSTMPLQLKNDDFVLKSQKYDK